MTLLVIADDEALLKHLPDQHADILISCGDLPDETIRRAAQRSRCRHILAVKGNHDSSAPFPTPIVDLHLRPYCVEGINFAGFCGAWKYKPVGNYLFEQSAVHEALAKFPPVEIFVTHNSPPLIHDRDDEVHLGFEAFTNYVERARPRLLLHGHQHLNVETGLFSTRVVRTYGFRFLEFFAKPRTTFS